MIDVIAGRSRIQQRRVPSASFFFSSSCAAASRRRLCCSSSCRMKKPPRSTVCLSVRQDPSRTPPRADACRRLLSSAKVMASRGRVDRGREHIAVELVLSSKIRSSPCGCQRSDRALRRSSREQCVVVRERDELDRLAADEDVLARKGRLVPHSPCCTPLQRGDRPPAWPARDAPAGASAGRGDRPKEEGEDTDRPNRPIGDSGERLSSSFRCRANENGTTDWRPRAILIAGAFCVRSSAMDTNGERTARRGTLICASASFGVAVGYAGAAGALRRSRYKILFRH